MLKKTVTKDLGGRPTKFTPELMEAICADIIAGTPVTKAFPANGIDKATGYRWVKQNPEFEARLMQADARWESKIWDQVTQSEDIKAKLIALKMKHPEYRDKGVEVKVEANATASAEAIPQERIERIQALRRVVTTGGHGDG